ncbi:MAG: hypothetical protein MI861_05355 [Pirellulales bacterium]|nr:hypothetical protein [Pirellulales bacterium]
MIPRCIRAGLFPVVGMCGWILAAGVAVGQPPGTDPPKEVFSDPDGTDGDANKGGLPFEAFLFQSESLTPVMMPAMTWEELERLQNLDVGAEVPSQIYSYRSLDIVGEAADERAAMEVTLKLSIESTDNKWVAIPLRMGNFNRLAPPDVSGVEEYFTSLARDGSGYLLWVRTKSRREATMRMSVSSRIQSGSSMSLDFQLPDAPSTVHLTVNQTDVSGDVIGRGYETLKSNRIEGGQTEFVIESGGGTFTLRWGSLQRDRDDTPLLEVDSRINVNWESPQEAPRATVQLTVQNVRGTIEAFEIRLPNGSVVPDSATLGAEGQAATFGSPTVEPGGQRRQVLIPEEERQQRIDLNFSFNVDLPSGSISSTNPLGFRVPEVVGALRHRGEITFQTSEEFRLRWQAEPWVRSLLGDTTDDTNSGRTYSFQFDRSSFELPLWLSAKQRQVRLRASTRIAFRETNATLEMLIRSSGRSSDGRGPQLDMAGWNLESIENAETNEPIDAFEGDGYPEIDFPPGFGAPPPIRIRAQHAIDPNQETLVLHLPRIIKTDDGLLVPTSTVDVVSQGRSLLVVDLEASEHLERIVTSGNDPSPESTVSSFRVDSHESAAVLVGRMVQQPPQITLACDGTVTLDGNRLQTTIDWTVTSRLDLEGVLPVRIPSLGSIPLPGENEVEVTGESLLEEAIELFGGDRGESRSKGDPGFWTVTVNSIPAELIPVEEDRYDLKSSWLADGTMSIRWQRTESITPNSAGDSFESLVLPRPAIEDVTVRGSVQISLRGTPQTELLSAMSPSVNELMLDALPPDPVRLRLSPRETKREELSFKQMVLRTAVGRQTRHEQLLATVQGGDALRVGLTADTEDVSVEAYIDKQQVAVSLDGGTLVLALPGDQSTHVVDLRVWVPETAAATTSMIQPVLDLPLGVGRVYWQITVPADSHLLWASPTIGRSMTWNFARWNLGRDPSYDDRELTTMIGAAPHAMPPGNQYLYIGSDVRSFQAVAVSRVVLWIGVGSLVLFTSIVLLNFPSTRHPLTAVLAAVLFTGLIALAPDAAVLAGQFGIIALVLVVVMIAVRALVSPRRNGRLLVPSEVKRRGEVSTKTLQVAPSQEPRSSITQTQALPTSASEASS